MLKKITAKWLARSGAAFLTLGLAGCIVIHADSDPEEKSAPQKNLTKNNNEPAWDCSAAAEKEIVQLHKFFEDWYQGDISRSEENFSRLTNILADDFQLITATGFVVNKAVLITLLKGGYNTKQDLHIRVENINRRTQDQNLCLLTYEEHGDSEGKPKQVLVSVVLRRAPDKPNGLEWLHVHEVNVPVEVVDGGETMGK